MKFLSVEKNCAIIRIYKKLFNEKNHDIDFIGSEEECFDSLGNYDYVIFEYCSTLHRAHIEDQILKKKPGQKILFLPKPSNLSENKQMSQETKDLIEKPFAIVNLLSEIELKGLTFL